MEPTLWNRICDSRDRSFARRTAIQLILFETLLSILIVSTVSCSSQELFLYSLIVYVPDTKIDWDAYMEQVTLFQKGEWDYVHLVGDTGPCVYPAGFLFTFSLIQWITRGAVSRAQNVFLMIYLITQFLVLQIYVKSEKVPPLGLILLCLSYRIHSIYLLRLFNDCIAMTIAYFGILFLMKGWPRISVLCFSFAVSIKMNVLLMAPSVLIVLLQGTTPSLLLQSVALGIGLQLFLGFPFLWTAPQSYISRAFDFSRVFLYEWTVNLKFLDEDVFQSKSLALVLLLLHGAMLCFFIFFKWCPNGFSQTLQTFWRRKQCQLKQLKPDHVLFVIFSGNFVGILCARSLHYQFYSWYFHSIPFLLWYVDFSLFLRCVLFLLIERCWNVYPSNAISSLSLLVAHLVLLGLLVRVPKRSLLREDSNRRL